MGSDGEAVVDSKLRVNGVQGLRIADILTLGEARSQPESV